MGRIVPGHFWANTVWFVVATVALVAPQTRSFWRTFGAVVFVLGFELSSQARHLRQHHSDPAPTSLEQNIQARPDFFWMVGGLLAALGLLLAF